MNRLLRFAKTWAAFAFVGASAVGVHAGDTWLGGDEFGGAGIVKGLALGSHLDPLSTEQVRNTEFKPAAYSIDIRPRLSMPAVDRSQSLVLGDQFPNTKMIMPLLVSDMDLNSTVSAPTSARSVGARPSLPMLKAASRPASR